MYRLSRRSWLAGLATLAAATTSRTRAAGKLNVVTTFTILADMVRNVGGEHVALTTLVGPDGDAHVYEPTPADARTLARADLVVVNGLGFEGWIDRLIKVSGYRGPVVVASEGIAALTVEENQPDPHACRISPTGASMSPISSVPWLPRTRLTRTTTVVAPEAYDRELAAMDREVKSRLDAFPRDRRKVITSHDAFRYFGRAYGIDFLAPVGLSTESAPSAGEIAALIRQMRDEGIHALFVENITDPRLVGQLAREAGAVIGGRLYSDSLSGPTGPAPTYLDMFRHNVGEIAKAVMD